MQMDGGQIDGWNEMRVGKTRPKIMGESLSRVNRPRPDLNA